MQRRYEGRCRPTGRPCGWPTRWILLSTTGSPVAVEGRPTLRSTGIEQWDGAVVTMRGEVPQAVEEASGTTAGGCWRWIETILDRPGITWIMSARALRDWTLIGLWDRLETGMCRLGSSREAAVQSPHERGLGRTDGMLISADPPTVAALRIGPNERRAVWVCAANYGWQFPSTPGGNYDVTARLVGAIATTSPLLAAYGLGGWGVTPGAMAYRSWRSKHLMETLYVHKDRIATQLERDAGCGGRIYVRDRGCAVADCYAADCRSMYPFLCAHAEYPIGLARVHADRSDASRAVRERPLHCCARVCVRTDLARYPRRIGARTEYPVGSFSTVLAGPELECAIKEGEITDVQEVAEYRLGSPVSGYARAAYAMREAAEQRGASYAAALAKRLAVALPGKLFQRETRWEECIGDYNDPHWGEWYALGADGTEMLYRARAGVVSRRRHVGLAACAIPQIPVWIWSLGRVWLWERMVSAGLGDVLYTDTDGLIVTARGYGRLTDAGRIRANEWGQLRYAGGPQIAEIRGPKSLTFGNKIIQSGAPREQRGTPAAEAGYWYRRPVVSDDGECPSSEWIEELRSAK